jgi:hypothetical protein
MLFTKICYEREYELLEVTSSAEFILGDKRTAKMNWIEGEDFLATICIQNL